MSSRCLLLLLLLLVVLLVPCSAAGRPLPDEQSAPIAPSYPTSAVLNAEVGRVGSVAREMGFQLGSRPPSCFNKCNACFPCQPVQAPTPLTPHSNSARSKKTSQKIKSKKTTVSSSTLWSEYANYKPEGWKCRCGNKLFNP